MSVSIVFAVPPCNRMMPRTMQVNQREQQSGSSSGTPSLPQRVIVRYERRLNTTRACVRACILAFKINRTVYMRLYIATGRVYPQSLRILHRTHLLLEKVD